MLWVAMKNEFTDVTAVSDSKKPAHIAGFLLFIGALAKNKPPVQLGVKKRL